MFSNMDLQTAMAAVSVFGLITSLWLFAVILWARKRSAQGQQLQERLESHQTQSKTSKTLRLWHEEGEATIVVAAGNKLNWRERLRQSMLEAGWEASPEAILASVAAAMVLAGGVALMVTSRIVPAVIFAGVIPITFWWYAGMRTVKRRARFDRQLVDGLELSARALRAGHPLLGSFQLIADEIAAPVGQIFAEICQEHEMGVDLEQSLRSVARRTQNPDMRLFSASLAINLRTGGNLAEVVEGLAAVIRERMKLQRRFRVLTAQTQFSKRILIAMPIIMFCVLNLLNPEYIEPLYATPRGHLMLLAAAGGLGSGWWMMNKMSVIRS